MMSCQSREEMPRGSKAREGGMTTGYRAWNRLHRTQQRGVIVDDTTPTQLWVVTNAAAPRKGKSHATPERRSPFLACCCVDEV